MKKNALNYIIRVFIQKLLGLLLYLIGAHFILSISAGIYFALLIVGTLTSSIIIYKSNYETLAERTKINTNSPKWDKVILLIFWLLNYFVIYLVAGIEFKGEVNIWLFAIGMLLTLGGGYIAHKAVIENTYLESTSRIQSDRNQTVCDSGPYAVIRHPAYTSIIMGCVGFCLVFQTIGVVICSLIIVIIIVIRTYLEDKMLKLNLDGYEKYSEKVRYRLIPYIW